MDRIDPARVAKWLFVGYAAALAAFFLIGADAPDVVLLGLIFCPYMFGPALAAAVIVKASRERAWAWFFVGVESLIVASTPAAVTYSIIMADRDYWTAAGASIFLVLYTPPLQYAAVAVSLLAAYLFGWRAKKTWLAD